MFFSAAFNLTSQFTGKERDAETGLGRDWSWRAVCPLEGAKAILQNWLLDPFIRRYNGFKWLKEDTLKGVRFRAHDTDGFGLAFFLLFERRQ
jgi:hypothetical protein